MDGLAERRPIVGRGYTSNVYEWDDGRVLKLFHRCVSTEIVEQKHATVRAVCAAGLPAPVAHEMLFIDGKHGIVFDRIYGRTMLDAVQEKPWTLFQAVRRLADLQAAIHRVDCPLLPAFKSRIRQRIEAAASVPEQTRKVALATLASLPDGEAVCHGDIHPGNVLETNDGLVAIDWDSATCGDAAGDIAITVRLMATAELPAWTPRPMHWLFNFTRRRLLRVYLKRALSHRPGIRDRIFQWRAVLDVGAPL